MKLQKLVLSTTVAFLMTLFTIGSTHAGETEIVLEFCEETGALVEDAVEDLSRNAGDAVECFDDFDSCH